MTKIISCVFFTCGYKKLDKLFLLFSHLFNSQRLINVKQGSNCSLKMWNYNFLKYYLRNTKLNFYRLSVYTRNLPTSESCASNSHWICMETSTRYLVCSHLYTYLTFYQVQTFLRKSQFFWDFWNFCQGFGIFKTITNSSYCIWSKKMNEYWILI